MSPLLYRIVFFDFLWFLQFFRISPGRAEFSRNHAVKNCSHSFTKSSFLLWTAPTLIRNRRFCSLLENVPALARNRRFFFQILPLSHGIVVFVSHSKIAPLLNEIVTFLSNCSHSHTESSFLRLKIAVKCSQAWPAVCCQNVPTIARNRHFSFKIIPLSYGIVVFAPNAKIAPLWSEIIVFSWTVKNVRASRFFIFRTVKNVRASRVFIFEIVVLLCFPDISVAKT